MRVTACLIAIVAIAVSDGRAQEKRPNFMVILCDDLGYGDLECYGHDSIKTPHLNRLAEQGLLFRSCYSSAPVCSPSRAGLLTGRTPSRIGIYDWIPAGHPMHVQKQEITIATLLRNAGFATCHVGKWHCNGKFNSPEQPQPGDHGFDYWFSTQNNANPSHHNPTNFVRNGKKVGPLEGYSCQIVADQAIQWLKQERDKQAPFFLYVCFHEPHEPVASPDELVAQYPNATKEGEAIYYANVTNIDRAVGKLMECLDEQNLAEDTLVFFTSDNGPETLSRYPNGWRSHGSPGPFRGMKLHLYEGGIRVPGILRWPGHAEAGKVVEEPIRGLDLLPTFCELAGAEPPADRELDGASFVSVFEGQAVQRSVPLYWHYFRSIGKPKAAMRVGDWMILGHTDSPELGPGASVHPGDMETIKNSKLVGFELYNLKSDVAEQNDLSQQEPQRLAELSKMLVKKYQEVQQAGPYWYVPPRKP